VKHTFLTGATGTIGSAVVPRLLAEPDALVTLLIRARDDADLETRLGGMFTHWALQPGDARRLRVRALRGDISLPGFGLSEAVQAKLAHEATHLIHCAASVKLNMTMAQALATAVLPTRTILALGRQGMQAGVLKKIDLVSTVGVWGRTPGHMPERRLPEVTDFHNTYEAAKAEAERVVWAEGQGLPITVHRPSMVVGETDSGNVIHFQVFYHLCEFLSGVRTFGVMPQLGHTRLDTVPVDWVADALCWASNNTHTAGQIFHLCAGPQGAIALPRLQQLFRDALRAQGQTPPGLRVVSRSLLERLIPIIGALAGARTRRALRGLPPVLAYLAEDQGFSNTQSNATFAAAGLPLPAIESYLGPVLNYYLEHRGTPKPA
jgi:thioester reductase-like protein